MFDGLTYAALGHLHGAQQVAPNVRYAGSPLPFSFSERHHRKSVALVDVADDGAVAVELRRRRRCRGRWPSCAAGSTTCSPPPDGPPADAWLQVVLTDPRRPAAPMERLRERWPHTLVLDFDAGRRAGRRRRPISAGCARQTDPVEVCALFVEWVDSTYPDRGQRDALSAVVEAVRDAERIA